jgi:diadenosine tetraphosphatase ApaH/serine/threonine PP2A family protein phosphatase
MRLALMADIHSNREAFDACLNHAADQSAEGYVLLGDYVGYGADPAYVVDRIMDLCAKGTKAVIGNHDAAIDGDTKAMNPIAATAIQWTRDQINPAQRKFLRDLPLSVEDDGRLFVHAEATEPARFGYITNTESAARDLHDSQAPAVFCGHVHMPAIYGITATEKVMRHVPVAGVPVPLPRHRRWLVVLGSVGQPRDGNPDACYAILDTVRSEITFHRLAYDIEAAGRKILAAGLPEFLATRLFIGR